MVNIFDQFGIKEVADVTLYSIHKKQDGSGDNYFVPALFLDTLKISSFEKAAENVWAEGGYGNSRLISWDYGKQINVNLEDALCSPASLGLCWGGILSADWQDANVKIQSGVESYANTNRISRTEKAFYPRNDKKNGTISNLIPHLKEDELSSNFDLLRISSVVDGTIVEGRGYVKERSYRWKLAIESAVNSIAQVPDRFFDVKGRSYPIDMNRKVSVNSLPDYENYKDAIIYKINTKTKNPPPLAKIIFDYAMESKGKIIKVDLELNNVEKPKVNLGKIFEENGYTIHADGFLSKEIDGEIQYYYPFRRLNTQIFYTTKTGTTYDFSFSENLYQILDEKVIASISPKEISAADLTDQLITYNENHGMTDLCEVDGQVKLDHFGSVEEINLVADICLGDYLAIIVDNNNEYHALIGIYAQKDKNEPKDTVIWYKPAIPVDVSQFKGLDMWLRFSSLNKMIYFLITKYNEDIVAIIPSFINANEGNETWAVDDKKTTVEPVQSNLKGKLWAYINPKTMTPYEDDYWFHQGEPFLIKSLTLAPCGHELKAKRINVKADTWPGMYMLIGETWIRDKETGRDERMQIKIPFCKVKSEHSLSLEAGGDPVTFNLELEVAKPQTGNLIEITTYETATKMKKGDNGCFYAIDGASEAIIE